MCAVLYAYLIGVITILSWALVEGYLISRFGTTMGKFLLRIQVQNKTGSFLSMEESLKRSLMVSVYGSALGIPYISFFTMAKGYEDLVKNKITKWDKEVGSDVLYGELDIIRVIISVSIVLGVVIHRFIRM